MLHLSLIHSILQSKQDVKLVFSNMFPMSSLTSFEQLPIEILFQIFDYLPYIDAINAFFSLNYRFNAVLLQYHQSLRSFTTPMQENPFWQTILSTISAQIEHLVITSTEFSLSLDSFPNLKSLVISTSFPMDYDELDVLLKSEQFQRLVSLKIKSEIVKDIFDYRKASFHKVLQEDNGLRYFESLTELGFSHRSMDYLRINTNLRSLSFKCLDLQCLSILLSHTPNLKCLNAILSHFGPNDAGVNLITTNLKQCSLCIERGVINAESFPILTQCIKQLSSSLIELSLNLHQIKPEESIYTGSTLRQQLFEPLVHLKSFHLYLRLYDKPENAQRFLSTLFRRDHHWTLATHGPYLYTLPFHFETLHDFVDFKQIESSNRSGVLPVFPTWSHIKSIEFSPQFKLRSNVIDQLKTKMPYLTSATLTVHCPIEWLPSLKDWLPYAFPNIRNLVLSNTSVLSTNTADPMVVSSESDAVHRFQIQCIEVKMILHEVDGVYLHIVRFFREFLEMCRCLESVTFHVYHLPRFPHIVPYAELDKTVELLTMGNFATKYHIKHVRHYIKFIKKNS